MIQYCSEWMTPALVKELENPSRVSVRQIIFRMIYIGLCYLGYKPISMSVPITQHACFFWEKPDSSFQRVIKVSNICGSSVVINQVEKGLIYVKKQAFAAWDLTKMLRSLSVVIRCRCTNPCLWYLSLASRYQAKSLSSSLGSYHIDLIRVWMIR